MSSKNSHLHFTAAAAGRRCLKRVISAEKELKWVRNKRIKLLNSVVVHVECIRVALWYFFFCDRKKVSRGHHYHRKCSCFNFVKGPVSQCKVCFKHTVKRAWEHEKVLITKYMQFTEVLELDQPWHNCHNLYLSTFNYQTTYSFLHISEHGLCYIMKVKEHFVFIMNVYPTDLNGMSRCCKILLDSKLYFRQESSHI